MTDVRYIGARLRVARIRADLTQIAAAKLAGVSRGEVANIEIGNSAASLGTFVALVRVLQVDPSELLAAPSCLACGDVPPPGFMCRACGAES